MVQCHRFGTLLFFHCALFHSFSIPALNLIHFVRGNPAVKIVHVPFDGFEEDDDYLLSEDDDEDGDEDGGGDFEMLSENLGYASVVFSPLLHPTEIQGLFDVLVDVTYTVVALGFEGTFSNLFLNVSDYNDLGIHTVALGDGIDAEDLNHFHTLAATQPGTRALRKAEDELKVRVAHLLLDRIADHYPTDSPDAAPDVLVFLADPVPELFSYCSKIKTFCIPTLDHLPDVFYGEEKGKLPSVATYFKSLFRYPRVEGAATRALNQAALEHKGLFVIAENPGVVPNVPLPPRFKIVGNLSVFSSTIIPPVSSRTAAVAEAAAAAESPVVYIDLGESVSLTPAQLRFITKGLVTTEHKKWFTFWNLEEEQWHHLPESMFGDDFDTDTVVSVDSIPISTVNAVTTPNIIVSSCDSVSLNFAVTVSAPILCIAFTDSQVASCLRVEQLGIGYCMLPPLQEHSPDELRRALIALLESVVPMKSLESLLYFSELGGGAKHIFEAVSALLHTIPDVSFLDEPKNSFPPQHPTIWNPISFTILIVAISASYQLGRMFTADNCGKLCVTSTPDAAHSESTTAEAVTHQTQHSKGE